MRTMQVGLTEEQKADRLNYICGSDAEAAMNDQPHLWRIKTRREEEGDLYDRLSGTLDYFVLKHFTRDRLDLTRLLGHVTEDLNAFWYEKQTGRAVTRRREWCVSSNPRYPFMAANLDGVSTTGRGYPCYWDAKWTGRCDEAFVLRHTPQGVHNATILGFDWWGLSVFIGNGKWEWIEQEIDPLYQATLLAREAAFWKFVTDDIEPPEAQVAVLAPKPQPKLRTVVIDGGTVDPETGIWSPFDDQRFQSWPNWGPDFARNLATIIRTEGAHTANNIARAAIKDLLPEDVGEVRRGDVLVKRDKAGAVRFTLPKGEE
jgi:hypothetical protein